MARRREAINDNERLLLESLERERAIMKPRASLGRYSGIADYLLREAEFFDLPDLSLSPFGMPQLCYANAFRIVRKSKGELQYAEGRALADVSFSVHGHAWCVDATGRVVDPTWRGGASTEGLAYFGKVFDLAHVRKVRRGPKGSAAVVDNWQNGFPLFK